MVTIKTKKKAQYRIQVWDSVNTESKSFRFDNGFKNVSDLKDYLIIVIQNKDEILRFLEKVWGGIMITKGEIKKELKAIAKMLDEEYKLEGLKTTRAIYRAVAELYNKMVDNEVL